MSGDGKLSERIDIPKCVRLDETLRAKLNVVKILRGRNLAMQVRVSLIKGVDDEFTELGKEAIEMLCRKMSEPLERPGPVSVNVGSRQKTQAKRA